MTMKKFLAPQLLILLILGTAWATGQDAVLSNGNDDQKNLQKYVSVLRRILDNYVEPVDVNMVYKDSIKGLVSRKTDSTLVLAGTPLDTTFPGPAVTSMRESLLNFEKAYRYLKTVSPQEDMSKRTEDAVASMFASLDPHSVYIEPETGERIREEFAGKFQGIGVQFDIIQDTIVVVSALVGGPSEKLGIQSGDRIIEIDGKTAVGFTNRQVLEHLRGPKNSIVEVTIKRPGRSEAMKFSITRDDIPLHTVDSSYMLDSRTGYIKVSRFAQTTYDEFMEAAQRLQAMGMDRMILDLRNNPGGYMDQAIKMSNEFFGKNVKIVSQKSRHSRFNAEYSSYTAGKFQEMPLIIMVNEGSASASEIVSGAVQDNDRGLIVGSRTFGKGLVQQQYDLGDGSAIRVTISKYYTPSGRLIQKPFSNGREDYAYEIRRRADNTTDAVKFVENIPDSLVFMTLAGRRVFAGGGVLPDHIVEDDTTTSHVFGFMRRTQAGRDFIRGYMDKNSDSFRKQWEKDFNGFREKYAWTKAQSAEFTTMLNKRGLMISDTVKKSRYTASFDTLYMHPKTFEKEFWIAEKYLKAELAVQVWGQPSFWPVFNDSFDQALKKALQMWPEVDALRAYAEKHQPARSKDG
jgi:carboxyl-terminal processing protease